MELIEIIQEVVSIVVPIIGLIVATLGVFTWRSQLKGKTEYELSRRLLKAVYELREAINVVRNPVMVPEEVVSAFRKKGLTLVPKVLLNLVPKVLLRNAVLKPAFALPLPAGRRQAGSRFRVIWSSQLWVPQHSYETSLKKDISPPPMRNLLISLPLACFVI